MLLEKGRDFQLVSDTLEKAFSVEELRRLLRFKVDGKNLDSISLGRDYRTILFDVISEAERQWWTHKLILGAREMNPDNGDLLALAQRFNLAPTNTPNRPGLERLIQSSHSFLDVAKWRSALGQLESQICSVMINGRHEGTGFLLGANVVMTNFHVMEGLIQERPGFSPDKVTLRFDYKVLPPEFVPHLAGDAHHSERWMRENLVINSGVDYTLDEDWLVDKSPYSQFDLEPMPKSGLPSPDELDYILLRTAEFPGNEAVGGSGDPAAPRRGWMKPVEGHDFLENKALFIVQHPKGEPLKLALEPDAVTELNGNQTRVFYRTNTEPGSSGSPCFDENWNLVALHHAGDPDTKLAKWNEGIPFGPIMELLRNRDKERFLGEGESLL